MSRLRMGGAVHHFGSTFNSLHVEVQAVVVYVRFLFFFCIPAYHAQRGIQGGALEATLDSPLRFQGSERRAIGRIGLRRVADLRVKKVTDC